MYIQNYITKLLTVLCLTACSSAINAQTLTSLDAAIVGDWSCTEAMDYMGYDAKSQMQWSFQKNQQQRQKTVSTLENEREKAQFNYEIQACWHLEGMKLILDQYDVKKFSTDHPELEAKVNLKAALADPEPMELKIKTLTANEMLLNLMIFDMEVEEFSIVCKR